MLDRTERVHGEVLLGAARPPEPSVIRHVHHQHRAVPHELTEEIRENALVTDYNPEGSRRTIEDDGTRAGLQLGDELGPAPHEPEHPRQRHEFSERNELNLIIAAHDARLGDQKRGVAEPPVHHVDAAEQHRRTDICGGRPEALDEGRIVSQNRRCRRLGPDHERRMLVGNTAQEREVDSERFLCVAGLPLERLLDGGLDDRDRCGSRRRRLGEANAAEGQRAREQHGGRAHPGQRLAPAQHHAARESRIHGDEHE